MKKPVQRSWIISALITVAVMATGALLFAFSGIYDVAASKPHGAFIRQAASFFIERSVRFHAQAIPSPDLSDSSLLRHGAEHFRTMCVTCHGAPGTEPSEIGKGLNPKAPELSRAAGEWTDPQLYWIISNGIKMTGMPAFIETHDQKEIWSLVAFMKAMAGLSPEEYRRLIKSLEQDSPEKESAPGKKRDVHPPWRRMSIF